MGVCQDVSPGNGGLGTSSAAAQFKKYPQFTTTLHTQPFTDIGCSCAVSCWWLIPLASQYITWYNLEASNITSQLCSFLTHRQPRHTGLDAVFSYSSPSKGRNRKIFVQSSPRWLGVCFFLLGSKTPWESLTGSTGFLFCGWLWCSCYGLSSAPASLAQPSSSCDRFCDEDPFSFGEDALWAQVLSEEGTVSESFPRKGWASALNGTSTLHFRLCHWFLACTLHRFCQVT